MLTNWFLLVVRYKYLTRFRNYSIELCRRLEHRKSIRGKFFFIDYLSRRKALSHQLQNQCITLLKTFFPELKYHQPGENIKNSSHQNDRPRSSTREGSQAVKETGICFFTGKQWSHQVPQSRVSWHVFHSS